MLDKNKIEKFATTLGRGYLDSLLDSSEELFTSHHPPCFVFRLKTSYYVDSNHALCQQKKITPLRRKSHEPLDHIVYEDISCVGADEVLSIIFGEVVDFADGIYNLGVTHSYDRDGYVDEWEYSVSPYQEGENS